MKALGPALALAEALVVLAFRLVTLLVRSISLFAQYITHRQSLPKPAHSTQAPQRALEGKRRSTRAMIGMAALLLCANLALLFLILAFNFNYVYHGNQIGPRGLYSTLVLLLIVDAVILYRYRLGPVVEAPAPAVDFQEFATPPVKSHHAKDLVADWKEQDRRWNEQYGHYLPKPEEPKPPPPKPAPIIPELTKLVEASRIEPAHKRPEPEEEMLDKRYLEPEPGEPKPPSYQADLDRLIGMAGPKAEVQRLSNLAGMAVKRRQAGLPALSNSFHMSFTGNPGTGKTTFARIVAKVLHHHGILPKDGIVEVDRSSLVGQHIGHSEAQVKAKLQEALGRVLFIDEFYALAIGEKGGPDFGKQVIDVLVKFMEDNRDNIAVIVAGYTEPMQQAIASNPGLKSRFTRTIHFPDYSAEELLEIFDNMVTEKKFTMADDAYPVVGRTVKAHHANRGEDFGNARDMRTLFERVTDVQANRVMNDNTDITVITAPDIREAAALCGMQ